MKFSFFYTCVSSLLSSCCILNIWKSCSDLISLCSPCWNVPILPPYFLFRNSVSSLIQSIDESYVWLIVLFISSISALFFFWIPFSYVALGSSIHSAVCLYSLGIQLGIHLLFFDFFEHTHNHFSSSLPEFSSNSLSKEAFTVRFVVVMARIRNEPQRLIYLRTWSPGGGAVWQGLWNL